VKEEESELRKHDFYNFKNPYTALFYQLANLNSFDLNVPQIDKFPVDSDRLKQNFTLRVIDGKLNFMKDLVNGSISLIDVQNVTLLEKRERNSQS
jgi:hypothetical protein